MVKRCRRLAGRRVLAENYSALLLVLRAGPSKCSVSAERVLRLAAGHSHEIQLFHVITRYRQDPVNRLKIKPVARRNYSVTVR
jgi:hypothetical protein